MSTHQCIHANPQQPSYYTQAVQSFSQYLSKKDWKITHLTFGALFGELRQTLYNVFLHFSDWQTAWKAAGFHDISTEAGYQQLKEALRTSTYAPPLILLHPVFASPAVFNPWIPELKKAQAGGKIGQVIVLQLPNITEASVDLLRSTLPRINGIYKEIFLGQLLRPMDLCGDSKGGYVGHIVSFEKEHIHDEQKIERRWHNNVRNPLVGKVITLAAPTWLCQEGCKDRNDIYPDHGFTEEHKKHLEKTHEHIIDIVATDDAISPTSSPLPHKQVIYVKHTHQDLTNCPEVCKKVIELLST